MTRAYLVVYEKGAKNWSAFSPDIPGCGSMGSALKDTRTNMRAAVKLYLSESAKAGEPLPKATATSVNFKDFDPRRESEYFVEWLKVPLPRSAARRPTPRAA